MIIELFFLSNAKQDSARNKNPLQLYLLRIFDEYLFFREMISRRPSAVKVFSAFSTGIEPENILFAHATDSLHVDDHCPDFSVVILHDLEQILITICGTRMIPAPKMKVKTSIDF